MKVEPGQQCRTGTNSFGVIAMILSRAHEVAKEKTSQRALVAIDHHGYLLFQKIIFEMIIGVFGLAYLGPFSLEFRF